MQKRRTHDGYAVTNALCEQAISYRKDGCTCINPFDDGAKTRLNDKSLNHITLKERGSTPDRSEKQLGIQIHPTGRGRGLVLKQSWARTFGTHVPNGSCGTARETSPAPLKAPWSLKDVLVFQASRRLCEAY